MRKLYFSSITKNNGFSLIELVIVISIIGIILAIAIPSFSKSLESAQIKADIATARTIGVAAQLALLDGIDENLIGIEGLAKNGYLDKVPEPQLKDKDKFVLTIEKEKIEVKYSDSSEALYESK